PNPFLFKKAVNLADCKPKEAAYIGDSERDIKGAKETGMFTVILDRGQLFYETETDVKADLEIKNLNEIPWIT
ncbi:MAG: HAD hydrolase-like protein, partial [Candidatus Thermoplasmatota archaeon]